MNYPEVIRWFGIGCLLILLVALIVLPVQAAEIRRPMQGDPVGISEVVDITGVMGWAEKIAYYGYSGDLESDPLYVLELPDTKKGYYQFYIDPKIFETRLGPWYQFYGNESTIEHGNLLMFRVVKVLPVTNITPGATPVPTQTPVSQVVEPKKFDTDYQIAYGDPFQIIINNKTMPARLWVFGRIDSVYNKTFPTSIVSLSNKEVQALETGSYTVLVQNPGKNAIFEVGYRKQVDDTHTIEELTGNFCSISGCQVKNTNIYGFQPRMVMTEFRSMIKQTDDPITEKRIEVAHPTIEISQVDETYYQGKDVLDIRGYTNVAKGTAIAVIFDEEKQTARTITNKTYVVPVQETAPNQWRFFQVYIPIDYDEIPVGQHEITARVPQGAEQTVPFYVYDLPAGQETPNATIKYISGNQFIPTPTPLEIRIIETVIQTQTIFVPVTPNDEQVYIAQKKASDANWRYWLTTIGLVTLVGTIVTAGSWYLWTVVRRARRKKG